MSVVDSACGHVHVQAHVGIRVDTLEHLSLVAIVFGDFSIFGEIPIQFFHFLWQNCPTKLSENNEKLILAKHTVSVLGYAQ